MLARILLALFVGLGMLLPIAYEYAARTGRISMPQMETVVDDSRSILEQYTALPTTSSRGHGALR